ncbi:MAG: ATP-grasp domain-containing protein [Acidobacteria bacterium]|nr:ATP-grasp domain-containing protein [Acidobacteriota bacterium]
MIRRLLIPNRGEIALRIIRACREAEIESVAVYSDADVGAPHVLAADVAFHIGPAPARDSYLSIPRILEAARATGSDAVHPGYGFLAENPELAAACERASLIFVGPSSTLIARMGSKIEARRTMQAAGVSVVPGITSEDQSEAAIKRAALDTGLPLLIKPSAGGGGKGMRFVRDEKELDEAIGAARREATSSFADGTLYLERAISNPRHVEVQILADHHGQVVHLFERDCSVQRRHQKIIEESPSPALTPELRRAMGETAVRAARAVGYRSAGTVEFLLEGSGSSARFYFLEMNTRLQVEHPVTETACGIDLVRAQLLIASGCQLPWTQQDLRTRGHAIECRIYAEDPVRDFLPQAGKLFVYDEPRMPGVRIDSGVTEGSDVPVFYDPLLAKLVASGETRDVAVRRAVAALEQFAILGVRTNIAFLLRILAHPRFRSGEIDTAFVDRELGTLTHAPEQVPPIVLAAAARYGVEATESLGDIPGTLSAIHVDPWTTLRDWRHGDIDATPAGEPASVVRVSRGRYVVSLGGRQSRVYAAGTTDAPTLFFEGVVYEPKAASEKTPRPHARSGDERLESPMPATVVQILAAPGQRVERGETLITLEAMKMQMPIRAPRAGWIGAVHCQVGDLVQPGIPLIDMSEK